MLLTLKYQWGLIYEQSIDKKPPNLVGYWRKKLKDL